MIVIDEIRITKYENSKMDLSNVNGILEEKLKAPKLSISSVCWYDMEKEEVKFVLNKPIPLYRMCRIISDLSSTEHIPIKMFTWKEHDVGTTSRGTMDIIVS